MSDGPLGIFVVVAQILTTRYSGFLLLEAIRRSVNRGQLLFHALLQS